MNVSASFPPILLGLAALAALAPPAHGGGTIEMISVNSAGQSANGSSNIASLTPDGALAVFDTYATNIAPGAPYFAPQNVYLRDFAAGTTTPLTVVPGPPGSIDGSFCPVISADGRYVVFVTNATDSFFPGIGGIGSAFDLDVVRHDLQTGQNVLVSVNTTGDSANDSCRFPAISGDGRFVVFESDANDLGPTDTNAFSDVYVRDMVLGVTTIVSVSTLGVPAFGDSFLPWISQDGRYVSFNSTAANVVPGDTNGATDMFRHDRSTGQTVRASVGDMGQQAMGTSISEALHYLSPNGRYLAFWSDAPNLVPGDTNGMRDVFVRDLDANVTTLVSVGLAGAAANGVSRMPTPSDDGRYVSFTSLATNLVAGDANGQNDVFRRDLVTGVTRRLTVGPSAEANFGSDYPSITPDGRYVAFDSFATNLVATPPDGTDRDTFRFADCWAEAATFSAGKPGTGGIVPVLAVEGGSCDRGGGAFVVAGGLGGSAALLVVGVAAATPPFPGGGFAIDLAQPFLALPLTLDGAPGAPGVGSASATWTSPLDPLAGQTIYVQAAVADPAAVNGYSLSPALQVEIG